MLKDVRQSTKQAVMKFNSKNYLTQIDNKYGIIRIRKRSFY